MPKIKTNRAAAKRFKVSGTGKIRRRQAYLRHINTHMTRKRKRNLGKSANVASVDAKSIRLLIPYL
jgi:large subunit ribosomal protein L35